jgi:transposase
MRDEGRAMASDGVAELFESLPDQAAPEPASGGLPRLRFAERDQVAWRPVSLDGLLADDHRVRLVWDFVSGLDLTALHATIKAVDGRPGHPPADPRILLALWLFATVEGIGSAREIARLCEEHMAFQWLCGGVGMNAKTLADFRVDHGAVLERLLVDSFTALVRAGVASLDRVAQDGVRVRASAGAASFRRHSTLQDCRREAEKALADLRTQVNADPAAANRKQAARQRTAEDRERRVRAALAVSEQLHAQQEEQARLEAEREAKREARKAQQAAAQGKKVEVEDAAGKKPRLSEPRASTTDAQARVMKMADGGFRPAYNVQFATDTKSTAIAAVSVDNIGSDMGKMAPMNDALASQYGERPRQHLVDGGFVKFDDIETLAGNGVKVFAPVPKPRDASRDRHAPQDGDSPAVAAWRQRMGGDEAKKIYKQRAATAECANAQARNRGLTQFVVRGLEKVKVVALWHALTHNMICSWRLIAT